MAKNSDLQKKQLDLQIQQAKNMEQLIERGLPIAEKYFMTKLEKIEAPKFKWTLLLFTTLLFASLFVTGFLVYHGNVDASNFTFLLGIFIGSAIALIGDVVLESQI